MSFAKTIFLLASFCLLLTAIALPCVPEGGSAPVTQPRPPLPPPPPGSPPTTPEGGASPQWSSTPPAAEEADALDPDDPMGDATPSGDGNSATVDVSNEDGDLSGPNGEDQNGGLEGDCIEVRICWYYWNWSMVSQLVFTDTGWGMVHMWVYSQHKVCNTNTEACPCP